jgi:threonine/homoserine/homoserine lactone efflux protein
MVLNKKGYTRQQLVVAIIVLLVFLGIMLIAYFLLGDRLQGYLQAAKDIFRFGK